MNEVPRIGSYAREAVVSVGQFLGAVLRAITWKKVLLAELAATPYLLVRRLEALVGHWGSPFMTGVVIAGLEGFMVLVAVLSAEEALRRGVRAWLGYPLALLAASWGAALSQWYVRHWFGLITGVDRPGNPASYRWTVVYFVVLDVTVYGGLAMLAYRSGQNGKRLMERVRNYELERVQAERRLIESRLVAAQAQVDPQWLVHSLGEIRNYYKTAPLEAERRLDVLIHSLQSAMVRQVSIITPPHSEYENP